MAQRQRTPRTAKQHKWVLQLRAAVPKTPRQQVCALTKQLDMLCNAAR